MSEKRDGKCVFVFKDNGRVYCEKHTQYLLYSYSGGKTFCIDGEDELIGKMGFEKYMTFANEKVKI